MVRDFKARIHTLFIGPDHLLHGIINLELTLSLSLYLSHNLRSFANCKYGP